MHTRDSFEWKKYFGTFLMACTTNTENIFPTAFLVVESENRESWSWFFVQMCDAIIDMDQDLVIISDRQKGFTDSVQLLLPNVHHSNYLRHLALNLYGDTRNNLTKKIHLGDDTTIYLGQI